MNRTIAPATTLPEGIEYISPERLGTNIWWLAQVQDNTCTVEVHWPKGTADFQESVVVKAWAAMLTKGTPSLSASEIQKQVDELGGYFSVEAGKRSTVMTIYGLQDTITAITELLLKVVMEAEFPTNEVEVWKTRSRNALQVSLEKVTTRAARHWTRMAFADTPYGNLVEPDHYAGVSSKQLRGISSVLFDEGCEVYVTGKHNKGLSDVLQERLEKVSGAKPLINVSQTGISKHEHLVKDGAIQSAIISGKFVPAVGSEERLVLDVANCMLGGYFGSRLMMNIREDKGFTYGISSHFEDGLDYSVWRMGTEVGDQHRQAALDEIQKEIDLLSSTEPTVEELERVRRYMIGSMLRAADGGQAMMNRFKFIHKLRLDYEYYHRKMNALHQVTPEQVTESCRKHIKDGGMLTITCGS